MKFIHYTRHFKIYPGFGQIRGQLHTWVQCIDPLGIAFAKMFQNKDSTMKLVIVSALKCVVLIL